MKITTRMHLRDLCCIYNGVLGNNEVLKCVYTLQYSIVGRSIDSYCNNMNFNKIFRTIYLLTYSKNRWIPAV